MTDQIQRCTKCGIDRDISHFTSVTGKRIVKVCQKCRGLRKTLYSKSKTEKPEFKPDKRKIELVESVDKDKLHYLITNSDKYNIGKSYVNGKLVDGQAQLTLLANYYESLNLSGELRVPYKQKSYGFGRYYGTHSLQLQNIARPIRHTISQEKLIDVDIANAHPTLLSWYCGRNGIPSAGLDYYIENRDACLRELISVTGKPKDEVKADLLAILNGRVKYVDQVENYPQWYTTYYLNVLEIHKEVCRLEPTFYKTAKESKQGRSAECYNVTGTCINYLMMSLENNALMAMYDVCVEEGVQVASLVYDGFMIYKSSAPEDLAGLFNKMIDRISTVLEGCVVKITEKAMNEGFEIDDEVCEYEPTDLSRFSMRDQSLDVAFDLYETSFFKIENIPEEVQFVQDIDFGTSRVLAINSAMGSGKTSAICRYIKEHKPKRVAVLSPRISYAKSICTEYNDKIGLKGNNRFRCYKEMPKEDLKTYNRVVISMESLYKVCLQRGVGEDNPFDLVVIDECQANLSSHVCKATNGNRFDENSDVFHKMINKSEKVILLDAFINAKTIEYLSEMSVPCLCYNYLRKMEQRSATIVKTPGRSYDALLPLIKADLANDKRLYIVMSSAKRAAEWEAECRAQFPDKRFKVYAKGEGKNINDVRAEWSELDCIFTTTTITVGINFDLERFHKCYMSFSSAAHNKVVDLFQSHYRVRKLIDKQVVVHISDMPEMSQSKVEEFCDEKNVCEGLTWFEENMVEAFRLFIKAPSSLKKLMSYDQLELNLSKYKLSKFVFAFLQQCNYDTSIMMTEDVDSEKKEDGPRVDIPTFADIKLIDKAKSVEIDMRRCCGGSISEAEKWQLEKFKMVELFTDGHTNSWVDGSLDNDIWELHYNAKRSKLYNIRLEKQINTQVRTIEQAFSLCHHKNNYALMSSKTPLKVDKMKGILTELGVGMSQKVGVFISKDRLDQWCGKTIPEYPDIVKTFGIRDQRKQKKVTTAEDCVTLLNNIFKEYGFTQLKRIRGKAPADKNGKREDVVTGYTIEDNQAFHKSNELAPHAGERIYDSMQVEGCRRRLLGS